MHILIVYAHHEPQSFNGALKDRAVSTLQQQGHQVKVSDLYAMNFQAIATHDDFLAQERSDFLKYQAEQIHATATRSFAEDIREEQAKLSWADLIIFQFPLWWFSGYGE